MTTADFHYEMVYSDLHDHDRLSEITSSLASKLREVGGVGLPPETDPALPFAAVVATGGTEAAILKLWRRRSALNEHEPILLIVHRTDNSLASALEALAAVRQQGGRGRVVSIDRLIDIVDAVRGQRAYLALHRSRLGLVGAPSAWLVASQPEAEAVQQRWGPTLVPVDVPAKPLEGTPVALAQRWDERDTGSVIDRVAIDRAMSLHGPLESLMAEHQLDAMTVRCFDLLGTAETSGCLALAEFNTSGIVAGCEGDIPSAIAMMLSRELLGTSSWMANPSSIDPATGTIDLAHCTIAADLVEDLSLDTHFESGIGVGISGRFRRQPVTLMRIGGAEVDQFWVADGELADTGTMDHMCRTQARVVIDPAKVREVMNRPLGNHLVLVLGHHAKTLANWWDLFVAS